jgi:pyruvate/2-oxoglutarate/acetoin dehydrogenase E1 component
MSTMMMLQAVNNALKLAMEEDPDVLLLGEDVAEGGAFMASQGLVEQFGEKRIVSTPITESAIIGAAIGAALAGLRPVAELMFVDFIGVCLDQLFNQAAKMRYMFGGKAKVPIVLRTTCGAGFNAGAQHSQSLEAWFMHVPGLKVVMPSTPYDAKGLLISSIRDDNPVVFIEHKGLYFEAIGEVPDEIYTIPIGKADIKREGQDITIVATGKMVTHALSTAEKLSAEGISVEVLDPRSLSPLDEDAILESVRKTHRLVIAHEEVKFAGSGAEIAALVAEKAIEYIDSPILRVGAPFTPVPFSPVLESEFIPGEEDIIQAVKTAMS